MKQEKVNYISASTRYIGRRLNFNFEASLRLLNPLVVPIKKLWSQSFWVVVAGIFLIFLGCDSNSFTEETNELEPHKISEIEARIALSEIRDAVNQQKSSFDKGNTSNLEQMLSQVNTAVPSRKFLNEQGATFYTFALQKNQRQNARANAAYYSDNLFVNISESNEISYYLFRYIPTQTWLSSEDDLSRYSGKVQWLSAEKQVITTLTMKNGQQVEDTTGRTNCFLVHKSTLCTPPSYPGLPTQCTHYYELVCPGGGDGPSTPTNPNDPGGDGGTGDPTAGGSPIVDKEKQDNCTGIKVLNPLTQLCECPTGYKEDVSENCVAIDPCDEVKKLKDNPKYAAKVSELKTKTSLKKETGYIQKKDQTNFLPLTNTNNDHSLDIKVGRNTIGFLHTHLNNFYSDKVDPNGDPLLVQPIRMFSPSDVISYLTAVKQTQYNGIATYTTYATMVLSNKVYTLKFNGSPADINSSLFKSAGEYKEDFKKYFKRYSNNERAFLHFLKDHIPVNGLELYKTKNTGEVEKKTLSNTGRLETTDC